MFEKRVVIKHERLNNCTKIGVFLFVLLFIFATGFFTAAKLLGHPLPDALPKLDLSPQTKRLIPERKPILNNSRWEYASLKKERECLAQNIYFEARDQDLRGQVAVGLVTLNRVKSKYFPDSICDVVWQQNVDKNSGKLTAQFSWTLDGLPDRIANKAAYEKIMRVAEAMTAGAILNNIADFTHGATHYHANYVTPYWIAAMDRTVKVGTHVFYKNG